MSYQMSLFDLDEEKQTEEQEEIKQQPEETASESVDSTELWSSNVSMLEKWGAYVGRQNLYDNAKDPDRRHRVWPVVESHFGGKIGHLKSRVDELYNNFVEEYKRNEAICQRCGVEPVTIKWLRDYLWDGKDIESYRNRCRTRQAKPEKYPPVSLKDFPRRRKKK